MRLLRCFCCCFRKQKMHDPAEQRSPPPYLQHQMSFKEKWEDEKRPSNSFPQNQTSSIEKWEEDKGPPKLSPFAEDFYGCLDRDDESGILDYADQPHKALKVARARHRMECSTDSQMATLIQELGIEIVGGGTSEVDRVLAWRKARGDFDGDDDDDEQQEGFVGDIVPQVPSDMEGVSERVLQFGFLKSDLQFECLLRGIPYEGSDGKPQIISKLMHYQDTLLLNPNTLQMLEAQCN